MRYKSDKQGSSSLFEHAMFVFALLLAFAAAPAHAERRVALVIGNSAYEEGALKNPVNDAREMRTRLAQLGFAPADIVYRENLKVREIGPTLREFKAKLGPESVALIFYAGHGLQVKGENFLPAVDARIDGEEDVSQYSLRLSQLMTVLAESNSRLNLVFLDACRNNPYKRAFRDGSRGLARAGSGTPSGTLIAYATRADDVAADGKGNNGVFTRALLAHMSVPGQAIEQMFKKVIRSVKEETGGKQAPWQEGSLEGEFYFVPAGAAAQVAVTPPAAVGGRIFKDCDACPEMVVVPAGSFVMGSPAAERDRDADESPQHRVSIANELAVGRYAITFEQWDACVAGGGCGGYRPSDEGWGRQRRPVINVSWDDAQLYLKWLGKKTGKAYRLLSEAEWEYAARAGTTTARYWGPDVGVGNMNCTYCDSRLAEKDRTAPVGSFAPNRFGLYDMLGNVAQWTEDCANKNYDGAPANGAVWRGGDCGSRIERGGSWGALAHIVRIANRSSSETGRRYHVIGFRVARALP
ncbi:MAG: SUMF1/EgtB/PvdO family nonheme iron enzyme [Pseudomonadota bacterium]